MAQEVIYRQLYHLESLLALMYSHQVNENKKKKIGRNSNKWQIDIIIYCEEVNFIDQLKCLFVCVCVCVCVCNVGYKVVYRLD